MSAPWLQAQRPVWTADASVDPPTVELPAQAGAAAPALVPARSPGSAAVAGRRARVGLLAVALSIAVALLLAAGVTTAVLFGTGLPAPAPTGPVTAAVAPVVEPARPTTFVVTGTITLAGGAPGVPPAGTGLAGGQSCAGTGAHADVRESAPVLVADATGAVVATGMLGPGHLVGEGAPGAETACTFSFVVPGVPTGADFYLVELGSYTVTYSAADLRAHGATLRFG